MYDPEIEKLKKILREKDDEVNFLRNELNEVNFRLERLIEQAKYELKLIGKIQHYLVPTEFPNISGFEFSSKFVASSIQGGDYFDVFDLTEKMKFGVVMSCASGYAMSALLMSVLMKFSGLRLLGESDDLGKIVTGIRDELRGNIGESESASLLFGMVNRRTLEFEFSILGDISAFYLDRSSGEVNLLEKQHPAFGPDDIPSIVTKEIALNPKDRLVLCSTGILQSCDLAGNQMTIEKLTKIIKSKAREPVHELRNEILFQTEKHTSGAEIRRDRTVVVVSVKDRVIKLAR